MFLYKHKYAGHKIGSQKMTFSSVSTDMETFLILHFNILNNKYMLKFNKKKLVQM